ncbi:translation initiation factor [Pseudozyma hubeiensis SY62]|uniref:Translation initiation factor n=1 Tax=Pseudozyma hubeiensis (strain SY62) TaxID=1305764 RepID=R9P6T6_PSEHS|nr:translation initiation factor [Pseudozyma hubeiensis SY62]GAC96952.1 translation initiation factor [Pseudozyma hubeiensis SY62]
MALNMDDLIGSMQHGFHAGDRGNDLNEIRDTLKMSLPPQHTTNPAAGPSTRRFQPPPGASSLDADVAMLSSSSSSQPYHLQQQQQLYPQSFFGGSGGGGPGSWGSQSSSSSNPGWGFQAAPANTPQQTPVETSALARQLQAELERNQSRSNYAVHYPTQQQSSGQTLSPPPTSMLSNGSGGHASPPQVGLDRQAGAAAGRQTGIGSAADHPRSYVNGFVTRDDSATPTRGSISPDLQRHQQQQQHGLASP